MIGSWKRGMWGGKNVNKINNPAMINKIKSEKVPMHQKDNSVVLDLPPLSCLYLQRSNKGARIKKVIPE